MSKIPLAREASAASGAGAGAAPSLASLFAVLVAHMTIRTKNTLVASLPKAIIVLASASARQVQTSIGDVPKDMLLQMGDPIATVKACRSLFLLFSGYG
jgi:hypothetical protein